MIPILFYYLPALIGVFASAYLGKKMLLKNRTLGISSGSAVANIVFMMTLSIVPIINIIWAGCIIIAKMTDVET